MKSIKVVFVFLIIFLAVVLSCEQDDIILGEPQPLTITINDETIYQTISGFGGANRMWGNQFLKSEEAKKAFGMGDDELGLSIFRVRIASNSNEWSNILESVKEASKYDVKIIAAPWSPPSNLKSNNSDVGGHLLPENYGAYKDHLNAYLKLMEENDVKIHAVSIQNEPDIQVSYESCDWRATEMVDFLNQYGNQIDANISAPESFNFNEDFTNTVINQTESVENFTIVAGHIYGSGLREFPIAIEKGKEIWMTEYLLNLNTGGSGAQAWADYSEQSKWKESMEMLNTVHKAMTLNWNAYIWWYMQRYYSFLGDGTEGTGDGDILKRGYAFSHYSKFVRPGFIRVGASENRETGLNYTAYISDKTTVVVLINNKEEAVNGLNIKTGLEYNSSIAFETSLLKNREELPVQVNNRNAIINVAPKSICTLVLTK